MSYNGSGTFVINSTGQPVVTGTVISSSVFNALTADLGTGLSTAITKDGQTTTTARVPFAAGINSSLTTDATSALTGSIITAGGISMQKALWVGTTSRHVGAAQFDAAITYGGITLSNSVTGTGSMVLATSPTITSPVLSGTMSGGTFTGTFSGALSGTISGSATLSGNTTMSGTNPLIIGAADTGAHYQKFTNNGGNAFVGVDSSAGGVLLPSSPYDLCILTESAQDVVFGTNNIERMRISAAGVAAFTNTPTVASDSVMTRGAAETVTGVKTFTVELIGASTNPTSVYTLGYRSVPRRAQITSSYTFILADAGQYLEVTMGSASQTMTIPPNSSVAYPLGSVIEIVAMTGGNNFTIVEGVGVTLRRGDGTAGTGTRTMLGAGYQTAYIQKIDTNVWQITGAFS